MRRGFTIVELLIVIVVIGILAAITIMAYNGIQRRAQIVVTVDGLKKVEKSLRLWMIESGASAWPEEHTAAGGTPFSEMIAEHPEMKDFLQHTPAVAGVGTQEWFYDNDGSMKRPAYEPCDDMYRGVNIVIRYVSDMKIVEGINKEIDGNGGGATPLACGKVRWHNNGTGGALFFVLSPYGDFGG